MEIRELCEEQIKEIYKQHLELDFPPLERRGLHDIETLMGRDEYRALGLFEADELLGYAFFIHHAGNLLIDYFAIVAGHRDKGLGSGFMRLITDYYQNADSLIAEIDDPDMAHDEAEKKLRLWRKEFYVRNGFRDTGTKVKNSSVHYELIECGKTAHSVEEIKTIYAGHYEHILPERIYRRCIHF